MSRMSYISPHYVTFKLFISRHNLNSSINKHFSRRSEGSPDLASNLSQNFIVLSIVNSGNAQDHCRRGWYGVTETSSTSLKLRD